MGVAPGARLSLVQGGAGVSVVSVPVAELGNQAHLVLVPGAHTAAVIDAPCDVEAILALAAAHEVHIAWALDTHLHSDFLSGALELGRRTGASVGLPRGSEVQSPHHAVTDGDLLELGGGCTLEVLHTPGHTPEHVAYLLRDAYGDAHTLFSGGSLLAGSAGRCDLLGPGQAWRLARAQRESLQRLMELPDTVEVRPTHGPASFGAAGLGIAHDGVTSIGAERHGNPLVNAPDDVTFLQRALEVTPHPGYFVRMRTRNQLHDGTPPPSGAPAMLTPAQVQRDRRRGAMLLDLRGQAAWRAGHLETSLPLGLDGPLAQWAGWLLPPGRELILVGSAVEQAAALRQLRRVGHDAVAGGLDLPASEWRQQDLPVTGTPSSPMAALVSRLAAGEELVLVDVRERHEYAAGHVPGALNLPVHELSRRTTLPLGCPVAVYCDTGWRATLAAALLENAGRRDVVVVEDGHAAWEAVREQQSGLW